MIEQRSFIIFATLALVTGCANERASDAGYVEDTIVPESAEFACTTFTRFSGNASTHFVADEDGEPHELRFVAKHLDDADQTMLEDEVAPVPEDSFLAALKENPGLRTSMRDRVLLTGDADGFYWVELVLYRNSGLTRGYVVADGDPEESPVPSEGIFSKVTCALMPIDF